MKLLSKTFIGASLFLGLTALGLPAQTTMNLGSLPLHFEACQGNQNFVARGSASEFLISPTESRFTLRHSDSQPDSARMNLLGANPCARIEGMGVVSGKANHLIGNNPEQWQTCIPLFSRVGVSDVYPGISMVYYGNQQQLEYDFDLAAGANPDAIQLRFDGAKQVSVNAQGELVVSLGGGEVVQRSPVAYQTIQGVRHEVAAGYKILNAHTAAFTLGNYNPAEPLVIDPILSFATYFGGSSGEIAHAVALDKSGNIYIAGETLSLNFSNGIPLSTPGAVRTNFQGGSVTGDAFIAKFDKTGSNLIYYTYLGGSGDDGAYGLAVDDNGNAYVTGFTRSSDFPTNNALFTYKPGPLPGYYGLGFVAELNYGGSNLVYSTYLSGYLADIGTSIAIDSNHNAYIAGETCNTSFPTTTNAIQRNLACPYTIYYTRNAFVAEIAAGGTNLNYCSYLGGTNYDQAMGIAVDTNGYIYVTGFTASTNFPTINGLTNSAQLNGTNGGSLLYDAFVCKFAPHFTNWVYSTLLGGSGLDQATGITADNSGHAYVVGFTTSVDFPSTNSPSGLSSFITASAGITNAFLTQITWNGTNTTASLSTVFGGNTWDSANGVALDPAGNIYIAGSTASTNFPVTATSNFGSLTSTNCGVSDVFVTAISRQGKLLYSTYLGGNNNDFGNAIAADTNGNAYVVGQTFSPNFPAFNGRQSGLNGSSDAFLAKILPQSLPALTAGLKTNVFTLSWPMIGEATTNLLGVQASTNLLTTNWTSAAQSPVLTNGTYVYTVPTTNPAQFFRLHLK